MAEAVAAVELGSLLPALYLQQVEGPEP